MCPYCRKNKKHSFFIDQEIEDKLRLKKIYELATSEMPIIPVAVYQYRQNSAASVLPFFYRGIEFIHGSPNESVTIHIKPNISKKILTEALLKIVNSITQHEGNWLPEVTAAIEKVITKTEKSKTAEGEKSDE